ncbi:DUF29 domain-containing protein [Phormidesmis priestleyi]
MTETTQVSTKALYDADFYAWTQEQAKLLRNKQWDQVDLENIIEEIESLGRQERSELRNRLTVLLGHLLKWQFQPDMRSKSWRLTIREQRRQIRDHIQENPSLKPYIPEAMHKAYQGGVILAAKETSLEMEAFPESCPYGFEEAIDDPFLPD